MPAPRDRRTVPGPRDGKTPLEPLVSNGPACLEKRGTAGGSRPRYLMAILLILLLLRWWLGTLPGYPPDLGAYKQWALWGATKGVHTLYDEGSIYDYPPLYGYLLAPPGQLMTLVDPDYAENYMVPARARVVGYSAIFSLLVKIPPLVFDLLLAWLLAALVHRLGLWDRNRCWLGWLAALAYLFNPAVLFLSGYWGQPDAVETLFVLLALTLILLRKPELGWVSMALGCLMKPLAAPYLPLLALATLARSGWRRLFLGGLAGLATFVAGFLPFLLTGRGSQVLQKFIGDIEAMPYTSVNGHNIWWLLGSWRPASAPCIGPLTPKMIGLGLFGIAYILILWWIWRLERAGRSEPQSVSLTEPLPADRGNAWNLGTQAHWFLAAAGVGFSFFVLSTHMHENHLFPVIPFLIVMAGRGRRWAYLAAIVSISILINMAAHDLILGDALLSKVGGLSAYVHPDLHRPLSYLELCMAYGNAVLTVLCYVVMMTWLFRWTKARSA